MSKAAMLYVTTPSKEVAQTIAEQLLEKELIACANILPSSTAIYRWEDKIQQDSEVILILKTRHALVSAASELVKELHPYDCPCVANLTITPGNEAFFEWIEQVTQ